MALLNVTILRSVGNIQFYPEDFFSCNFLALLRLINYCLHIILFSDVEKEKRFVEKQTYARKGQESRETGVTQ